jgi:hypothetical protein
MTKDIRKGNRIKFNLGEGMGAPVNRKVVRVSDLGSVYVNLRKGREFMVADEDIIEVYPDTVTRSLHDNQFPTQKKIQTKKVHYPYPRMFEESATLCGHGTETTKDLSKITCKHCQNKIRRLV